MLQKNIKENALHCREKLALARASCVQEQMRNLWAVLVCKEAPLILMFPFQTCLFLQTTLFFLLCDDFIRTQMDDCLLQF